MIEQDDRDKPQPYLEVGMPVEMDEYCVGCSQKAAMPIYHGLPLHPGKRHND